MSREKWRDIRERLNVREAEICCMLQEEIENLTDFTVDSGTRCTGKHVPVLQRYVINNLGSYLFKFIDRLVLTCFSKLLS